MEPLSGESGNQRSVQCLDLFRIRFNGAALRRERKHDADDFFSDLE